MEKRRKLPRLCFLLTAALSLLGVALRTACMLACYESDIGYFTAGPLPTISTILYFIAVAAPVVCLAAVPGRACPTTLPGSYANKTAAALLAISLAFVTLWTSIVPAANPSEITEVACKTAILAAVYFLVSAPRKDTADRYPDWLSMLGFAPILWSIAAAADTYFDPFVTMNNPVKISLQMGLLGFMLIILAELRFRLNKPLPRYSMAFWAIGSFTCLVGGVPATIAACVGRLPTDRYVLYAYVLLCAGLYGLSLLYDYTMRQDFGLPEPTEETQDTPADTPEGSPEVLPEDIPADPTNTAE